MKNLGLDIGFSSELVTLEDGGQYVHVGIKKSNGLVEMAIFKYVIGADGAKGQW